MKKINNITYIRNLIGYFKSHEINPTIEEEDRIWSNIMSEVNISKRKKKYMLDRWQVSFISMGVAAMLAGMIWLLQFSVNETDGTDNLYSAYKSMDSKILSYGDRIQVFADDIEIAGEMDNVKIDYNKSDKNVYLGGKKVCKPVDIKYHQIVVPRGRHISVVLSDGSKLQVNAGTRVVFPDKFDKNSREIFVDGEIFIDVVKNKESDFIVHTTSCDIQVLGTAFNVQAYSNDNNAEVALLRGSVKLKDKNNKELFLKPDELAVIAGNNIKDKVHVNAADYILWTEGLLKLDSSPLSSVFKRLERYYGVRLNYTEEVGKLKLNGRLDLNCPVEEVLYRIGLTAPIVFTKNSDIIDISKDMKRKID